MPYLDNWDEFSKAADRLYSQDPWKVSYRGLFEIT